MTDILPPKALEIPRANVTLALTVARLGVRFGKEVAFYVMAFFIVANTLKAILPYDMHGYAVFVGILAVAGSVWLSFWAGERLK